MQKPLFLNLNIPKQASAFRDGFEPLSRWFDHVKVATRTEPEPKETLAQKRAQLQSYETLQRDIAAHEGAVESVATAASAVIAAVGDPQISQQLYNIKHDYKTAKDAAVV